MAEMLQKCSKLKRLCHICDKIIIGSTYKFKAHLYQHNDVPPRFVCTYCSRAFFRRDLFKIHVNSHEHKTSQGNDFACDHCGRRFASKRTLISHLSQVHEKGPHSRFQKYKCTACSAIYCEERLLKYHIRKQHFNLQEKENGHLTKRVNETWVEQVKQTNICVQMTKLNNNIIEIKKCNTLIKTPSDHDSENSVLKDYFMSKYAHEQNNYSKAICDYCKKEMLKKSLVTHIRERHLQCRKFHCDTCGRDFNRHYQFINHKCDKIRRRRRAKKLE